VLRIPATVLEARLGDELVLLDLATERYLVLDPIGSVWWSGIASGLSVDDIVATVVAAYDVTEDQAKTDGLRLLSTLATKQLLSDDQVTQEPA
jgi:hypothetical protein